MKCDAGWPACNRCISTGRICDGYGIWGGGGNAYQDRVKKPQIITLSKPTLQCMPISLGAANFKPQGQGYLEWFFRRSVLKLPCIFGSSFWDTVILQASSGEQAILHATLALGAAHKNEIFRKPGPRTKHDAPDKHEQYALNQYTMAISTLTPHLVAKNQESFRITLITCLVFVCLEFLLGNWNTGFLHLQKGLKLLEHYSSNSWRSNDLVDRAITDTFFDFHLQCQLFGIMGPSSFPRCATFEIPANKFESLIQSKEYLHLILEDALNIAQCCTHLSGSGQEPAFAELQRRQSRIRGQLTAWRRLLSNSLVQLQVHTNYKASFSYKYLSIYHIMTKIILETCLETRQESIFEKYTSDFISLMAQLVDLLNSLVAAYKRKPRLAGEGDSPFGSSVGMGWIPPLYFTAIKCRQHRLRIHAIRLLTMNFHKEGVWDSQLAGSIAHEVMEVEEGDYYKDFDVDDSFPLSVAPCAENLTLPVLPLAYRVHRLEVQLPSEYQDKVKLACWRRKEDGSWVSIAKEFDVWRDGVPTQRSDQYQNMSRCYEFMSIEP